MTILAAAPEESCAICAAVERAQRGLEELEATAVVMFHLGISINETTTAIICNRHAAMLHALGVEFSPDDAPEEKPS